MDEPEFDWETWAEEYDINTVLTFYILENGVPVEVPWFKAMQWISNPENRRVERTDISEDGSSISTVFIPYNPGPNRFFETMIFGGCMDGFRRCYATLGEAMRGHWKIVEMVRAKLGEGN